jgi:hypothetical protein
MTITLEQFQKAVPERRRECKHGARRYESELVSFAVAHARGRGERTHFACSVKELGVTMSTLQSWQQREAKSEGDPARLREVVVSDALSLPSHTSPMQEASLTLTTSSGHIVRGLSTAQVNALLRVLP